MSDVTQILAAIDSGDPQAAEQLLPLVYDELRKLAAAKLAQEKPGQTLQATALVHEAYLRLVAACERARQSPRPQTPTPRDPAPWDSRGHFFAAAAEAMRRILVEPPAANAPESAAATWSNEPIDDDAIAAPEIDLDLLELNAALDKPRRARTPAKPNWSSFATSPA